MWSKLKNFRASEDGAVTVDWVVLTAAVVGLAGAVIVSINGSSGNVSSGISSFLAARPVGP